MTVHVKRGGAWIDADGYQEGDEVLIGGHTPAVVTGVGVGEDGVPFVDMQTAPRRPLDHVTVHLRQGGEP
jgi:hypothetical protein